ncbi:MAG TPA: hypothetical protein VEJ41_07520 [Candidatus Acidoferrales bacterium]|nr:hypothetical protein [Candidatus Acidoferrales bacterium]
MQISRCVFIGVALALALGAAARAATVTGVLTSYVSGNEGTDMAVRTIDGKSHAMWFDNMKKPLFEGKPLPWCPEFPCAGWPSQLVLNKTRVTVTTYTQRVEGTVVVTPTTIELAH